MNVTRTTTDIRKLERLYWEGLEEGRRFIEETGRDIKDGVTKASFNTTF